MDTAPSAPVTTPDPPAACDLSARPAPSPAPSLPFGNPPTPTLTSAWPTSAQVTTAFLLGVALTALASHALGYFRWGSRPTDLERGAIPAYRINLNRADRAELLQLPGVGDNLATRIEQNRASKGPYRKVDDLRTVKGVGPATLERLRGWVEVGEEELESGPDVGAPDPGKGSKSSSSEKKSATHKKAPATPIDINRASGEELQRLPDIGPSLAQRIIETRGKKPFEKIEDLTRVPGIKEKRLEALRPYVTVGKLATDERR